MAFCQFQFFSRSLNVASTVHVILPESDMGIGVTASEGQDPPKVLYLLHGYSDDHSIWMRRTSIERYASRYRLAVVMPAVNHSFYTNEAQGEKYFDYVSQELPETVRTFFRVSSAPEDTYVAGLSMGGYGALKLALTYPERFRAAGSFSGVVDIAGRYVRDGEVSSNMKRIFGDCSTLEGTPHDLFHLLKKAEAGPRRPDLYISCGTSDSLFASHEKMVQALEDGKWNFFHLEKPDTGHSWAFWDEEIDHFLHWALDPK